MIGGTGLLWLVYAVATRNSGWISSPYVHTPQTWHTTRPRSTTIIAPPPPNTAQKKSSMPTSIAAAAATSTTTAVSSPQKTLHRILAYGDSLTAGTSGPNLFPYAQYLQSALSMQHRDDSDNDNDNTIVVVVRHRGLPGWTTQGMLDALDDPQRGLRSAVNAVQNPPLSLVILLAGTNDLAYGFTAREITANLLKLHAVCLGSGVVVVPRTLAIGIPPSGYQAVHENVAETVATINENLRQHALQNAPNVTYMAFPFPFEQHGENWYSDSLHFSEKGYQVLGESLAPVVEQILQSLEAP
jgi:lysophospholipase L1-like esterase